MVLSEFAKGIMVMHRNAAAVLASTPARCLGLRLLSVNVLIYRARKHMPKIKDDLALLEKLLAVYEKEVGD